MTAVGEKVGHLLRNIATLLGGGRDSGPLDSVAALEDFVATRSAYVAQKTLYGYVKTRMGTRYVAMFEDKNIISSLNIAKFEVFAACLSDLTVYAVATALPAGDTGAWLSLALRCYAAGLRANADGAPPEFSAQASTDAFERRLALTDWRGRARTPDSFSESPQALVRWAPIEDKLKKFDHEIIENSVKFTWRDIREQFNKRLDTAAIAADWARRPAG
jgi:hypothetical protein